MTRVRIALLLVLIAAVPLAAAAYWPTQAKPCFVSGTAVYRLSDSGSANFTVRIDNEAAHPDLRLQVVDDPAAADFVLVDGDEPADACSGAVERVRIDAAAAKPDLTVALSRAPANTKIFVRSARYSAPDAAALFAAMWRNAEKSGRGRKFAARD